MSRVFLTVLDAVGAGEAPDAAEYGDAGANTLGHVIEACHPDLPNMAAMGLGKGAYPIHQSGKWYTNENIDQMLMERHLAKKARMGNGKNIVKCAILSVGMPRKDVGMDGVLSK